ncbi:MAG TPA: hypothetical protein VHE33_01765 [Acidobacteriaceae bacterium]|nr:hypothetical protein [Acidobacteriaceae bacterium]
MSFRTQLRSRVFCLAAIAIPFTLFVRADGRCQSILPGPGDSVPAPMIPQPLQVFSQVPLSTPPFGYLRTAQCDDSGTMFFAASTPPRTGVTYLSLSADGQRQTVYPMPKYVDENPWNTLFSVPPDGKLQVLFVLPGQQPPRWISFDKDGKITRVVTLSAPSDIDVRSFAATSDGSLLLLGFYPLTKAHGKDEGNTYTAIFNRNGDLVTRLTPEDAGIQPNGQFAGSPEEPAAVEGDQFFSISSSGKSLEVIATDGSVVRRLPLPAVRPGDQLVGLNISGNLALMTYMNFKATPRSSYLLLNAATGEPYRFFLPPAAVQGSLTCFDSSRGFTFLSGGNGHLSLIQSALP